MSDLYTATSLYEYDLSAALMGNKTAEEAKFNVVKTIYDPLKLLKIYSIYSGSTQFSAYS